MSNSVKYIAGSGNIEADVIFVAEAPGETEDKLGIPLVGKSGQVFNEMLELIGLNREQTYITNVVKVRPDNNRTPTDEEINSWRWLLYKEIADINPKLVVCLGKTPLKAMLMGLETIKFNDPTNYVPMYIPGQDNIKMKDFIGNYFSAEVFSQQKYSAITTVWHPAYSLYNPHKKKEYKQQFLSLKDRF